MTQKNENGEDALSAIRWDKIKTEQGASFQLSISYSMHFFLGQGPLPFIQPKKKKKKKRPPV